MPGPHDSYNRPINYLRVSVTDRCNLNCVYCSPPGGTALFARSEILSYEEIARVGVAAAALGISKIRLTGGEPLVRPQLARLVAMLAVIPGIDDVALTTNGLLLDRHAAELRAAGLRRVNVSLDSLDAEKFRRITRGGDLAATLRGIEAARRVGLSPVKVNVVVMGGVNDDEIEAFVKLTRDDAWHVRFIELMPFVADCRVTGWFVPVSEVMGAIARLGVLEPSEAVAGNGPAKYYRLRGAAGTIGFISPVSDHFCFSCNRLRLTADGKLRVCLLSDREVDLRPALRADGSAESLKEALREAIRLKPKQHELGQQQAALQRPMTKIGG